MATIASILLPTQYLRNERLTVHKPLFFVVLFSACHR